MSSHLKKMSKFNQLAEKYERYPYSLSKCFPFQKNNLKTGSVNGIWIGAYGALLTTFTHSFTQSHTHSETHAFHT